MSSINVSRVLVGGLLAGLVINMGETVLNVRSSRSMEDLLRARNLPELGGSAIGGFVFFALLGIATVWLYAVIGRLGQRKPPSSPARRVLRLFLPGDGHCADGDHP